MQTNLKFNTLQFFAPSYSRKQADKNIHLLMTISKVRKTHDVFYLYLNTLLDSENLKWEYIRIAHDGNNLFLTKGDEYNGFKLNSNKCISNKNLMCQIFDFFKIEYNLETPMKIKLNFSFRKVENDVYLLKKI
jgi:hypothetical protein